MQALTAAFAGLAFGAAAYYASIAAKQLSQTQTLVQQSIRQADASATQAAVAKEQGDFLLHQAEMNAAVVTIGPPNIDTQEGVITFFVENWGKETSGDCAVNMGLYVFDRDDLTPYARTPPIIDRHLGPIPPSGAAHFPHITMQIEPKAQRAKLFRLIESNKAMIVIVAAVTYDNGYRVRGRQLCYQSSYFAPKKEFDWSTCDASFFAKLKKRARAEQTPK